MQRIFTNIDHTMIHKNKHVHKLNKNYLSRYNGVKIDIDSIKNVENPEIFRCKEYNSK